MGAFEYPATRSFRYTTWRFQHHTLTDSHGYYFSPLPTALVKGRVLKEEDDLACLHSAMVATMGDAQFEVLWRDTAAPELDEFYDGPQARTEHIKAGWRKAPGHAVFKVDTIWEKDVKVSMRDGTNIRVDIFRPANSDASPVPALIAWSPYGKSGRGQ